MYLFSCSAVAKKALDGVAIGEQKPFIVYIDFADLFGAEHLCKLYLLKEGFSDIVIEKRKQMVGEQLLQMLEHDDDLREAAETGYHLRMFASH